MEVGLISATMGIGYKAIRETFTTAVTLDPAARAIVVRHKNGPFRKLENVWGFTPQGETACDVAFSIDYEFSSPMLAVLMGAVFDTAFRKFAAAFETRAGEVYGRRAPVQLISNLRRNLRKGPRHPAGAPQTCRMAQLKPTGRIRASGVG